jgi:hypothetical protein
VGTQTDTQTDRQKFQNIDQTGRSGSGENAYIILKLPPIHINFPGIGSVLQGVTHRHTPKMVTTKYKAAC